MTSRLEDWLEDWQERNRLAHAVGEAADDPVRIVFAAVEFVALAGLASGLVRAAMDHGRRSWEAGEMASSNIEKAWLAVIAVAVIAVLAPLSLVLR